MLSKLFAMFKVPEAARETVWPLSHCCLTAGEVMCGTIVVGIAEHDNQMPPKISARVALIEIETSHTDRILEAQSGSMYQPQLAAIARWTYEACVSARYRNTY